uniref:Uncharacterized protein n=1 Tax=Arundo donax TaxID=35708 RepID=A0A0A9DGL9_ARUDO
MMFLFLLGPRRVYTGKNSSLYLYVLHEMLTVERYAHFIVLSYLNVVPLCNCCHLYKINKLHSCIRHSFIRVFLRIVSFVFNNPH